MTAHMHTALVDGCYRCELGKDEEAAVIAERREKVTAVLSAYADDAQAAADAVLDLLDEEGYL